MDNELLSILLEIKSDQNTAKADIAEIKMKLSSLPCEVNKYKIGLLQKVVYGAVGIILVGYLAAINTNLGVNKTKKTSTKIERTRAVKQDNTTICYIKENE